MTAILGISAFYHDSAAALVVDGRIVAAAQEERFTRKKHDHDFPRHAVQYCLDEAGIARRGPRLRRLLRQAVQKIRPPAGNLPGRGPGRLPFLPPGGPVVAEGEAAHPLVDPPGPGRPLPRPLRVHRSPRVARGQRLLPVALRGGGHPHRRRRRRVVDHLLRRRPRQPHRAEP